MSDAVVTLTGAAHDKVLEFMKAEGRSGLALRMAIAGRGPGGFQYQLGFVTDAERKSGDLVSDAGGFDLVVDAASADDLRGTTVDFVESRQGAGFKIDNPNPLWRDPLAAQIQKILDEEINPAVQSHGGFVSLLEVEGGRAYIRLGGGCQGCGMADVTLKQGIEVRIKELVPAITEVVDSTDHAGGSNPYYRPGKGGRSAVEG